MSAPGDECSYLLLIGSDLPAGERGDEEVVKFRDEYAQGRLPKLVETTEGVLRGTLYQLIEPDERGDRGPEWLASYELNGRAAAVAYLDSRVPGADDAPRWHLLWRRRANYSGAIGRWARPYLYLIGMDVPIGTTDAQLAAFNTFYDGSHVPEVVDVLGYDQALRFERHTSLSHDAPGCPRFMTTYDGTEEIIRRLARGIPADAIKLDGPPAWNRRDTRWRLIFRRVASYARRQVGC